MDHNLNRLTVFINSTLFSFLLNTRGSCHLYMVPKIEEKLNFFYLFVSEEINFWVMKLRCLSFSSARGQYML